MNREKIIQIAEELSYSHGGTSASLSFENLVKFWDIAQREAVWAAADCQLARSCDRHGYDKYGDGDAIREMAKLREQERDDFESDVDTLAQHNIELQLESARLRDALTTIIDAQPKISAIELQIFARNVLKGI